MQKPSLTWLKFLTPLLFVLSVFLLTRCGKDTGPASGTFGAVYANTLKNCTECHVPGTSTFNPPTNVKLDFTTQTTAYNTLKSGKVTGGSSAICAGLAYITASINSSYLMGVLFQDLASAAPNYGGKNGCTPYTVHYQDQHLSADEKASLTTWINAGAPNN